MNRVDIENMIINEMKRILILGDVEIQTSQEKSIESMGLDSFTYIQLMVSLEKFFEINLEDMIVIKKDMSMSSFIGIFSEVIQNKTGNKNAI